jgi:hypothetical protein
MSFFLIGCSSNYLVKDFPSKNKFYEDFNNSVNKERVNIILTNDSSFSINNGVVIINDTLFALRDFEIKRNISFAKSDISDIKYNNNDYKSGTLLLNTGENVNVNNINFTHDSIQATAINKLLVNQYIIPIYRIKTIDFKNRSEGTLIGFLLGGILGYLSGRLLVVDINHKADSEKSNDYYWVLLAAPIVGIATGLLISEYIGYQHYYHFNN